MNQRFLNKVKQTPDCWEWVGGKNQDGYGNFWFNEKVQKAHLVGDVEAIRASSETQRKLATKYGVSQRQISRIKRYERWAE